MAAIYHNNRHSRESGNPAGVTLYSQSEVLEKRESKSRPDVGIVRVRTTGFNQDGKTVIGFIRTVMVFKRGRAPHMPRPT